MFFTKDQLQTSSVRNGKSLSCINCKLYRNVASPRMNAYGNYKKKILVVGEAPGEVEDMKGKPWQGRSGRKLINALHKQGIDLFDDCLSINSVNCRPYKNREPSPFEIDCCRHVKIHPAIKKYNPKVIIVFGKSALQSLIGDKYLQDIGGISKWRGIPIPDYDYGCWIIPTYHPSFVERDKGDAIETIWAQDLKKAIEYGSKSLPDKITPRVKIIKDLQGLKKYNALTTIAFDYETTGLKPHAKGHRIVCVSIAISPEDAFVFMLPETKYDRLPFLELLNNPGIGKRAHNMKFEQHWTRTRLRADINNWEWDSMLAAHLLDNRPGITGLKFQTYVNFGIADYSSEITPYLQSKEKNANGFNRIMELVKTREGKEKLLHYCALDSIYEYNLSMKQIETIDYDYLPF